MELFRCIVVIATLGLAGCQEDPEEAANRLFVESSALLAQYEELPQDNVEERLALLQQVQENLQRVVSDYPGSSLAVEIVSTGMVRNIEIDIINQEVEDILYLVQYNNQCSEDYRSCILQEMSDAALNSTYDNQALYIAYSGDVEGAINFAEINSLRNNTVGEISIIQARLGDIEGAIETFLSIEGRRRYSSLIEISFIQAFSGDIDGALHTLSETDERVLIFIHERNIFSIQASSGDIDGALERARRIEDEMRRYRALIAISVIQTSSGDVEGALETARSIDDEGARLRALREISEQQASSGDIEGALETARSIENERYREQALSNISQVQESSGDIELSFETALNIENGEVYTSLEVSIIIQASSGDIEGALETARSIEDASLRFRALSEIFETLYLQ